MPKGGCQIRRVTPDRAAAHLAVLRGEFPTLSNNHFARLSGLSGSVLHKVSHGHTIAADTEARILAVRPEHVRLLPPRTVPAGPAREHIKRLLTLPYVTCKGIGQAAGVSGAGVIYTLRTGTTVTYSTHVRLLAVTPEAAQGQAGFTDRGPTMTRLRALMANGWTGPTLSEVLGGGTPWHVGAIMTSESDKITVGLADAVKAMYDRIGDTPGLHVRTARHMRALGYHPPIHYDEDMTLIPGSVPEDGKPKRDRQADGRMRLVILAHTLRGLFPAEIGTILRMDAKHPVDRTRRRVGLATITNGDPDHVVIAPGQDDLIAAIRETVEGIDIFCHTDAYDVPGIDYAARYRWLRTGAWREESKTEETEEAVAA